MANQYLDISDLKFVLQDVHSLSDLFSHPRFADYDRESIDLLLDSVKEFSDNELFSCFREMDEQPAYYENGTIIVHPQIETAFRHAADMGLINDIFDEADGGMQLPASVHTANYFILDAANNNISGYLGLTSGAAELIVSFGDEALKERFVPRMLAGEWAGTMALTEPQAGSSLSDITTTGYPNDDGSYSIKGQKIFISGGDHQYCENFVHLTLVRIDGAPAGTRGVSLFAIPKFRDDGSGKLVPNDVTTAADYQKLGQRGYCTTHLMFGENDNCQGWLVGEANRGLSYMFKMMNGARIAVGRSATAVACAAYHASYQYACERPQGRRLSNTGEKDLSQEQTLIINHPDIRRMLMFQKAVWMGALSLSLEASKYYDLLTVSKGEEHAEHLLMLEILTPIAKTYPSEKGIEAVSAGLQVLGGYGFCSEFVLQQYYRDIRIMSIYEGTTGIQSLDLLGRKVTMENGKAMKLLAKVILQDVKIASQHELLQPYASKLAEKLAENKAVLDKLIPFALQGQYERFLSDATVYMEFLGTIVIGWQWLKMATTAIGMLSTSDRAAQDYLESIIDTMKFYYKYEMPKTSALAETLMDETVLTIAAAEKAVTV